MRNEEDRSNHSEDRSQQSAISNQQSDKGYPFWPTHVLNDAMILYALIGVIVTLSVLLPFGLHEKADPLSTPEGIKPEWYFLPMYQALKYVPKVVGVLGIGLFCFGLVIWPFIEQALFRRCGSRRFGTLLGMFTAILMIGLAVLGTLSETTVSVSGTKVHFDLRGVPHLLRDENAKPHDR